MLAMSGKSNILRYVLILVALVALGLSITALVKPCKCNRSKFGDFYIDNNGITQTGSAKVNEYGCKTPGLDTNLQRDICWDDRDYLKEDICSKGTTCIPNYPGSEEGTCKKSNKEYKILNCHPNN